MAKAGLKNDKCNKLIQNLERRIKKKLRSHLLELGFNNDSHGKLIKPASDKASIRQCHLAQRLERQNRSLKFYKKNLAHLLDYFASGKEVLPEKISPKIELISSGTKESALFRLATLMWSVPVSEGYGRRMRFLVWDENNGKLIGIFALGDPVFNLNARDEVIGWQASDRKERLVNVMDSYVLGALPPYNLLLGGKLVACLVRTKEVRDYFSAKYRDVRGVISGKKKHANLVLVTTSSSLGRSSIYNRLHINGIRYFESIGYTAGYGHFHVSASLFDDMREYLKLHGHTYSEGNRYGSGPNWKLRTIRATLELMNMDRDILHHGIKREIFICRLAQNAEQILRGELKRPLYNGLLSVKEVSNLALERWIVPRALRRPAFIEWKRDGIKQLLNVNKSTVKF